ncbi:hypothetical protein G7Y89_g6482 [Cudoniella acicularis]|uniref:Enoyl reductase (ER) domain-containing protein n=1 Tax=Cudoniella acicularis TaxID=354080 RepID=A0A8H4RMW7_9HELO|nr:hypothetical protein G7Y89_g6482 [Cudoniella acicularis]
MKLSISRTKYAFNFLFNKSLTNYQTSFHVERVPVMLLPISHTVIKQGTGGILQLQRVPLPTLLEPDQILVKNFAVALNPCDWKMPSRFPYPGATDGSDFAGEVLEIGPGVLRKDLEIGDRVCGAVHASNPACLQSGTFAEYVVTYADLVLKVPDAMSWENAAAIGGCVHGSLGLALWDSLDLPGHPDRPASIPAYVLVYGGSTASGTLAIQLVTAAGLRCITTCSPKNFDLVKSYGAEAAFDYNSPTCAQDIKTYTKNRLKYAFDTIAETKTLKICYEAIGRLGGRYTGLEVFNKDLALNLRKAVKPDWVIGLKLTGKGVDLSGGYGSPPDLKCREFGRRWFQTMQKLIDDGKIRSHPPRVMPGGIKDIFEGIEMMRKKEVSGEKLVYRIT